MFVLCSSNSLDKIKNENTLYYNGSKTVWIQQYFDYIHLMAFMDICTAQCIQNVAGQWTCQKKKSNSPPASFQTSHFKVQADVHYKMLCIATRNKICIDAIRSVVRPKARHSIKIHIDTRTADLYTASAMETSNKQSKHKIPCNLLNSTLPIHFS